MRDIVDSIAVMTDLRNKDALEVSLASVLFDLTGASDLCLWRVVSDMSTLRLRCRVRLPEAPCATSTDALLVELSDLPSLASRPDLLSCYEAKLQTAFPPEGDGDWRYIFPVTDGRHVMCLLEIRRAAKLPTDQERLIFGLLRIYRNYLGILDYGECDELTGLLNRRTFDESFRHVAMMEWSLLAAQVSQGADRREPVDQTFGAHLAVVDIDYFKRINDKFGHPYGDEVLVLLSRLMSSCFRDVDRLFRFGGEEFVVMLPGTSPAGATSALNRFRKIIEDFEFPQIGRVTVSIGFTTIAGDDTGSAAFGRADEALYAAKRGGRNQIQSFEALVSTGILAAKADGRQDAELF
eukprot:gene15344-15491_t